MSYRGIDNVDTSKTTDSPAWHFFVLPRGLLPGCGKVRRNPKALRVVRVLAALGFICGNLSSQEPSELIASIRPYQSYYHEGEAIDIDLTIRNVTDSSIVVFSEFAPPINYSSPDTVITFEIIGPDGKMITRSQVVEDIFRRMDPNYCFFQELAPRCYLGGPIYLNRWPYKYALDGPGVYRIKAKVEFRARAWLETIDPDEIPGGMPQWFPTAAVIEGIVETNEITIEIRAQGITEGRDRKEKSGTGARSQ